MGSGALPVPHTHGTSGRGEEHAYARRRPEESVLYGVVQEELETFLARAQARERLVPRFVERELRGLLCCGTRSGAEPESAGASLAASAGPSRSYSALAMRST